MLVLPRFTLPLIERFGRTLGPKSGNFDPRSARLTGFCVIPPVASRVKPTRAWFEDIWPDREGVSNRYTLSPRPASYWHIARNAAQSIQRISHIVVVVIIDRVPAAVVISPDQKRAIVLRTRKGLYELSIWLIGKRQ